MSFSTLFHESSGQLWRDYLVNVAGVVYVLWSIALHFYLGKLVGHTTTGGNSNLKTVSNEDRSCERGGVMSHEYEDESTLIRLTPTKADPSSEDDGVGEMELTSLASSSEDEEEDSETPTKMPKNDEIDEAVYRFYERSMSVQSLPFNEDSHIAPVFSRRASERLEL